MNTNGWILRRDGSFVRLELPPPGRWVLAMSPTTAIDLAYDLGLRKIGKNTVEGIKYRLGWSTGSDHQWYLYFGDWPGKLIMADAELSAFIRAMKQVSQETNRINASIPSSGEAMVGGV